MSIRGVIGWAHDGRTVRNVPERVWTEREGIRFAIETRGGPGFIRHSPSAILEDRSLMPPVLNCTPRIACEHEMCHDEFMCGFRSTHSSEGLELNWTVRFFYVPCMNWLQC